MPGILDLFWTPNKNKENVRSNVYKAYTMTIPQLLDIFMLEKQNIPNRLWNTNSQIDIISFKFHDDDDNTNTVSISKNDDLIHMTMKGSRGLSKNAEQSEITIGYYIKLVNQNYGQDLKADLKHKLSELYLLTQGTKTLEDVFAISNKEAQAELLKEYPLERIKTEAKVKIIEESNGYVLFDLHNNYGTDLGRWLEEMDGHSKRKYLIKVPRKRFVCGLEDPVDTVQEALAWSYSKFPENYNPEIEA